MPDRWLVLTVRVPSVELVDELAGGLVALGGSAVEQELDLLTTYVPEPEDVDGFLSGAADHVRALAGTELEMLWRWQDDEDWSRRWKEGLAPRRVGDRITVTQPWNPVAAEGAGIVIVVDPASAFGTGEHASTRGALRLLESAVAAGDRVLDVGAGTGILSIAAVRLGAQRVLAVESDAGSLGTAQENLERNGVAGDIDLVHAAVDDAYLAAHRGDGFHVIAANVLSGVLVPLLPSFRDALAPGGRLILAGILESEAAGVRAAAAEAALDVVREDVEGEWWSALLKAAQ